MGYFSMFVLLTTTSQILAAPQFITFKEGKVGVNFGGYHAAAGLGGLLGAGGAGGLFAEAGTPHGQSARAGLGGGVSEGGSGGGLYAGATAGGNVGASAGLAGGVGAGSSAGVGYAAASAGDHHAGAGMGGVHKNVHADFDFDAANEVNAPPLTNVHVQKEIGVAVETHAKPEVHAEPQPPVVIEKHIYHTQPVVVEKHHKRPHRLHNKFLAHGYIGGAAEVAPPPIGKRIDVGVESVANVGAHAESGAVANGGGQVSYTKQVQFQRNPQFFADIFNIPISTLKAVGSFLGNAAGSTSVSVQKSASVQGGADSDAISSKHAQSLASSQAEVSVKTPDASKLIDDIFAIPINTLSAVNKFLVNNVPARKQVQVSADGTEEARVRLGPHARRRASKQVFVQYPESTPSAKDE